LPSSTCFWVSRLGAHAVATVGLTESLLSLVFSVAMGVSMSTTAVVARRTGERDLPGAATAAVQAIALGIVIAVLMGVPGGGWFASRLLGFMGADAEVIATGHRYAAIVLGGNISVMLLFLNNAIFRGAGDASIAMRVLWFSNLINLALDPLLIFGLGPFPAMGVTGAAVATLTGRTCGVLYQTWILTRGHSRIRIGPHNLAIVPRVIGSLARVSITGVLQGALAHTAWMALVRIISTFGSAAVAGYTVGFRIFLFAILPAWGLSGAAATMVGQNLGARKPERAQRAVYVTAAYNMMYLAMVAAVFIIAPQALISVFTVDPAIAHYGVDYLRILAYGNLAYGFGMVMVQSFNGAGDTVTPTIISLIGYWLCQIPLAWVLAHWAGMGVRGVFWSIPISNLLVTLMGLAMFLRGSWKRRRI
jgi:putative MATE family efflux protein